MEAPTLAEMGDLCHPRSSSPEGETVCAALARYENTLRDAIREIHVDVNTFKLGMERRLEETVNLSGPLGRAVAQLQQENRQLRNQLEALTRQVELLSGMAQFSPTSPSPSTARFSSRATFSVSSKTNSIEKDEPIEVDHSPTHAGPENGHTSTTEHSVLVHGKISPPSDFPHEHSAPVAMRMQHLPITATTKTAEIKGPNSPSSPAGSPTSPVAETSPTGQSATSTKQTQPIEEPVQPVSSTWTSTPVRVLGSPHLQEKAFSAPSKSVTYSGLQQHERESDASSDRSFGQVGERRRELVRSQTLPRNIGAQTRRSIFERLDSEASNSRPIAVDSKPKLKRSQSFGVSSASSIKQILLEWCRSKTIGYQNIDLQNFSSSWSDGMAFCALVHSFFPTEFDYNALSPANRKHNFELSFGTAEEKAGCDRLIEVDDMMIMGRKPDPMCVFTYVQSLYNHLRKFE
uniref:Calponin-homology (CH) domain-containing protein n=1 Tax=Mola mola TaxID=94237 RepID=A0A3Q3WD48_MOLML